MSNETFESLLSPHLSSLRRMVHARLRGNDHTDDVMQQALLRAFSRRGQLRSESKFKSWLLSIALNEVRMHFRASRPQAALDDSPHWELVDTAPSPEASCQQREREDRLYAGIARLSTSDRTAIHLVDLNELTAPEAARKLSVSTAALKSTHFRARQRLVKAIRKAA